jgi:hypothetical protein
MQTVRFKCEGLSTEENFCAGTILQEQVICNETFYRFYPGHHVSRIEQVGLGAWKHLAF